MSRRGFDRYLVLEVPERTADGSGGFTATWDERGGLWAKVDMRSGGLRQGEFGRTPRLQLRITMPGLPQGAAMRPAPGDRLRDGGRLFEVEAVHDADDHRVTVLASELTVDGGDR